MRAILICLVTATMFAADPGVPLRPSSKDYEVAGNADAAKIAAAIIPSKQVRKMFSPEIAKRYIVVEVAIYPGNGAPFDIESSDFALRVGQRVGRADRPSDLNPWPEAHRPGPQLPVDVTAEAGVIHEGGNDPIYGQRGGTATYAGIGVAAPAANYPPPPPDPGVDPRIVFSRLNRMALAEGATKAAIAGYLYFPQYAKHKKSDEIELQYTRHDVAVNLVFPKQ